MALLFSLAREKTVRTSDVAKGRETAGREEGASERNRGALNFRKEKEAVSFIRIPLERGTAADRIMVENRYMDKELWIYVRRNGEEQHGEGSLAEFYGSAVLTGDTSSILSGTYEIQEDGVVLKIGLTRLFEYRNLLEDGFLKIEWADPKERYERIVVIDPGCGGEEAGVTAHGLAEKDVVLQIARKLKEKLDRMDVKAYYTRMEDVAVSWEERAQIANETAADLFVSIRAAGDESRPERYGVGCFYNGKYFLPGFGNVELADRLEYQVVSAVSGKADGLWESGRESLLSLLEVPAAQIYVGFLTNARENGLLGRAAYQEKIADGIAAAIEEALGKIGAEETG
jgi:N-acetylmuramoyl-L-alanine amidase